LSSNPVAGGAQNHVVSAQILMASPYHIRAGNSDSPKIEKTDTIIGWLDGSIDAGKEMASGV
jgi:hypothetical protein